MPKARDLDNRVAAAIGSAQIGSMHPVPREPKPTSNKPEVKDVRELISDPGDLNLLTRLISLSDEYGQQEREAANSRKPITAQIKEILGKYPEVKAGIAGGIQFDYYETKRSTIVPAKLLEQNVSPAQILAATVTTTSSTLRVGPPKTGE